MRCRLCGAEAVRIRDGDGHEYDCPHCGKHWIGPLLVREVLRPRAERLTVAVSRLSAAGRPRVELRGAADIERVLIDAEAL